MNKKLTVDEIIETLERNDISFYSFAVGEFEGDAFEFPNNEESIEDEYAGIKLNPKLLGKWKEVDSYGGEGKGEEWYSVKHFTDHDVYIKTEGYYQSYHGTDFEGYGEEVRPKTITKVIYE